MRLQAILMIGGVSLGALAAQAMGQNLLTNGDFEADPFDSGWSYNLGLDAAPGSGLTAGSDTAAMLLPTTGGQASFSQALANPTGGLWALEFLFAAEQPASGVRAFQVAVQFEEENPDAVDEGQINLVVSSSGQVQVYDSTAAAFQTIIAAGAFVPSVDSDGDDDFGGPSDDLNPLRMRIEGDFRGTPIYDVFVENLDAGTTVSAEDVDFYQYRSPQNSEGAWQVEFITNASGSTYGIDNVSLIPEPAGAGLALGGLMLLGRRTRRGA